MTDQHWIPIFLQQSQAVMTFWNVYIIVTLGAVGFLIQRGAAITKNERILSICAFVLFALSNGIPLYEAQEALVQIKGKLENGKIFSADNACLVISVHVVFDLIIVGLLAVWPFKLPNKANPVDAKKQRN